MRLRSGEIIAYEALSRGAEVGPFADPRALFRAAERQGRVRQLDMACWETAVHRAAQLGLLSAPATATPACKRLRSSAPIS